MLEELARRQDVYNHEPILRMALDEGQVPSVRRAATECAATLDESYTLEWLRRKAEHQFTSGAQRKMAMQALANLQRPNKTRKVFEQIADGVGSIEARVEAIRLIGKYRNLASTALLMELSRNRNHMIARAARAALDHMIEANGGRRAVAQKMLERAYKLRAEGQRAAAEEVLETASRLDPTNGKVLVEVARLAVA
jgi:hypothetical protein